MTGKHTGHTRPPVVDQARAAALLETLAAALNAAQDAGLEVRLKHGAVFTTAGYVLPLADDRWCARTLTYTEFPADGSDDE